MKKSRLATRINNINMLLLTIVLFLMTTAVVVIIHGINNESSRDIVRAYSMEGAEKFYSYISQDLALVRKIAHSKAVAGWFADEENPAKKAAAFEEVTDYTGIMQDTHMYFCIEESMNEYSILNIAEIEELVPAGKIDPSVYSDIWYFETIASKNDYSLKIDADKFTGVWRVWINHKVMSDGKLAGVFSAGLRIPDTFSDILKNYSEEEIRGYVIDRYGIIQMSSAHPEIDNFEYGKHLPEENVAPVFTSVLNAYRDNIDGVFVLHLPPEIIKLSKVFYGYAAIKPIGGTDWSIVIIFNNSQFVASNLLPLLITMLAALILYAVCRNTIIKRLIFIPLGHLTRDVSEGKAKNEDFFGADRNDDIGELSRTIRDSLKEQQRQEQLLHTVNKAATVILAPVDEKDFKTPLLEGMELMGNCVDVGHVYIWRNEMIDGDFCYVLKHKWSDDKQGEVLPVNTVFSYKDNSEWEEKFSRGECVNGPLSALSDNDRELLQPYKIRSVLIIPVHLEEQFWGFISFNDCRRERFFSEDEVNILRSASLMMVSAVNRNEQAIQIIQAHERTQILLDTMPLTHHLWERSGTLIDCNEEAVKIFDLSGKHEFIKSFFDFSPEYQPDGQLSRDKAIMYNNMAFEDGRCVFDWIYQMKDGQLLPAEVTLVRVNFGNEHFVAGYARDLREYKKMMQEIDWRDSLLHTVNDAATVLLRADTEQFEKDFYACMNMIAEAIGTDRVYIWKNHTIEGKLHCSQMYEWSGGAKPQQNTKFTVDISYEKTIPTWADTLSSGRCINSMVRNMPQKEQEQLIPQGILSIFVLPVFWENQFWGFVGYDDCHIERVFSENEESILRSGGLLLASALLRNYDVEKMVRLQAELKEALKEAQDANDAKTNFLARMSHEMRTPLNAVIGLSELMLENANLDEDTNLNLEKIYNSGSTLLSTVNDILDISKIEAGKLEFVPAEYDIPSLLNDTITQSIINIGEKPIKFVLEIGENLPARLYGDDLRIKQMLNNLLSNAFKYTMKGSVELGVSCKRDGDLVWLTASIRDTGFGIKKEDLEKLFVNYGQIDLKSHRTIAGTGLGLHITKRVADLMGGSISVESEYGKGSVFTIRIPQQFVDDDVIGKEAVNSLRSFRYLDSKRNQHSKLSRVSLPYARVLVVDDVSTNLDVFKGIMKPYGMKIDCVTSGLEAVEAVRSEKVKYNAIFMDHMMPEMDGIETLRIIREEIGTEYAKTVPVIALTANAIVGNESMFLSLGFQAFIPKPIEISRLDAVIQQWVRDRDFEESNPYIAGEQQENDAKKGSIFFVDGINMQKAIHHFRGDTEAFLQVLRSYKMNILPLLDTIRNPGMDNLKDYTITVHGIKGASWGIYAKTAGDRAKDLEKAAKDGDLDFIKANNAGLIEAVEELTANISEMLEKEDRENPKPKKDKPDSEVLLKLLTACESYDMDGIDGAIAEIENFKYDKDDGLALWLRQNIDQMNISQIKEKLKGYGKNTL